MLETEVKRMKFEKSQDRVTSVKHLCFYLSTSIKGIQEQLFSGSSNWIWIKDRKYLWYFYEAPSSPQPVISSKAAESKHSHM